MVKVTLDKRLEVRNAPPNTVPILQQNWYNLLFLHWKYDQDLLQKSLPSGLFVDLYKGDAYVSIVPFFMTQKKALGILPAVPGLQNFIEVNVRTYVYDKNGIPGVWFYSLDLNSYVAVEIAKYFFSLPYHYAQLHSFKNEKGIQIIGKRPQDSTSMHFFYKPEEAVYYANTESLDFFLIERYLFFTFHSNSLKIGYVNHLPYPLSKVSVYQWDHALFASHSLQLPDGSMESCHYSTGFDVDLYNLKNN